MPLGKANPKVVPVDYFSLVDHKDLSSCLDTVYAIGYVGTQQTYKTDAGQKAYKLVLSSELQQNVIATLGQVVVWDGVKLSVFTAAEFTARYNPTS